MFKAGWILYHLHVDPLYFPQFYQYQTWCKGSPTCALLQPIFIIKNLSANVIQHIVQERLEIATPPVPFMQMNPSKLHIMKYNVLI